MVKPLLTLLGVALVLAQPAAPPSVAQDGVRNAASLIPPGLPGGAIAPGSMFVIEGVRLAPAALPPDAWGTSSLAASAIELRIEGSDAKVSAVPLRISADRIVAVMPADAPLGEARLTVAHSGQESLPHTIRIVEGSFGIFTVTAGGHPPDLGALDQPAFHAAIPTARSGQMLTIWGTGLGRTREPEVFVGSTKARVASAGTASCCAGMEKIEFELPAASPAGCAVPVQVRVEGGVSSNVITIPVSAGGGGCSDPGHWLVRVSSAAQRLGLVALVRADFLEDQKPDAPEAFTYDLGFASFTKQTAKPPADLGMPSVGGCTTYAAMIPLRQWIAPPLPVKGQEDTTALSPLEPAQAKKLDAGAGLWVRGATGSRPIQPDPRRPRYYSGKFGGSLFPRFFKPGRYDVRGAGGADVGKFAARIQVPGDLRWTNRDEIRAVERSGGVLLRWTAADDSQIVVIVAAGLDRKTGATAVCLCLAPAAAHEFEIPSRILSTFPETEVSRDFPSSFILMAALPGSAPPSFRAQGLDAAYAFYLSAAAKSVTFR